LNKLKILNNREIGPGELKLLSFVTGEGVNLPVLDDLKRTTDPEVKKQLIQAAAQSVLSAKTLMQLDNVKDGHQMTFGDTGYALYRADKIPVDFNWSLMVFEIDEDTLKKIAEETGGKYYRATDTESLEEIYKEIDALEKGHNVLVVDSYKPFAFKALLKRYNALFQKV